MSKVKVAVRVRPLNKRELKGKHDVIVEMRGGTQTHLKKPLDGSSKLFNFDHSFWSTDKSDHHFADQEQVFDAVGTDVLTNIFEGYNACIFAYGQTGSGKTYTMMGDVNNPAQHGIIPRLCNAIFQRIESNTNPDIKFKVEVSYMEIYNEKVADLLNPKKGSNMRVREHKATGPYVEGLSKLAVNNYAAIDTLMAEGNKVRHTAATKMNDTSSRSHAVFTLNVTQAQYFKANKSTGEKVSRISLVDLAGSERSSKTGATGDRLKEGANINKSLTTLGLVISALADATKNKKKFIPYRDSTLTWLLKDNLGGNSKTVMVATISPASDNFDETLSTLRYADRAKRIVNHAIVNEDPNARVIRELQEELERLRSEVGQGGGAADPQELLEMKEKLAETENLMKEMNMSWEEKLKQTEQLLKEKQEMLDERGASVAAGGARGLRVESKLPHFICLSSGDDSSAVTLYTFKEGITRIGNPEIADEETPEQDVDLHGDGAEPEHAIVEFDVTLNEERGSLQESVVLHPIAELCFINGEEMEDSVNLKHGDLIQLGEENLFRFNHPTEAQRLKKLKKSGRKAAHMAKMLGGRSKQEEQEHQKKLEAMRKQLDKEKQAEIERLEKLREEAQREAEAEMRRKAAETETLRQQMEEMKRQYEQQMQEQLKEQMRKQEEEKRLLEQEQAENHLRSQEEVERLRQEAAAEAERVAKMKQEAAEYEAKMKAAMAAQLEEAEAAKRQAAELVRESDQSLHERERQMQELKARLEEVEKQREVEAEQREKELQHELAAREAANKQLLAEALKEHEAKMKEVQEEERRKREEAEALLQATDAESREKLRQLEQESLEREEARKREKEEAMAQLRDKLNAEQRQFEEEQRRRQEVELENERIRLTQDIELANERKIAEEERQAREKEMKRNQEAKDRWLREAELQRQLKEAEAQMAEERRRADNARKELAKAQLVQKDAVRRSTQAEIGTEETAGSKGESPEDNNPFAQQIQEIVALMQADTIDEDAEEEDDEGEFDEDDEGEFDEDDDGDNDDNQDDDHEEFDEEEADPVENGDETNPFGSVADDDDNVDDDNDDMDDTMEPEDDSNPFGNGQIEASPEPVEDADKSSADDDTVMDQSPDDRNDNDDDEDDDDDDDDDVIDLMSSRSSKPMSRRDSSTSVANNPFLSASGSGSPSKKPPTPSNDDFNPFAPKEPAAAAVKVPPRRHSSVAGAGESSPGPRQHRARSVGNTEAAARLAQRKAEARRRAELRAQQENARARADQYRISPEPDADEAGAGMTQSQAEMRRLRRQAKGIQVAKHQTRKSESRTTSASSATQESEKDAKMKAGMAKIMEAQQELRKAKDRAREHRAAAGANKMKAKGSKINLFRRHKQLED